MTDTMTMESADIGAWRLTPDEVSDFQRLVFETTTTRLDDDAAARRAGQLLYLTRALIGQLPEEPGEWF